MSTAPAEDVEYDVDDETYVLLPIVGSPGEHFAVFADGSYARWTPMEASGQSAAEAVR